jgi:hypothetical protein
MTNWIRRMIGRLFASSEFQLTRFGGVSVPGFVPHVPAGVAKKPAIPPQGHKRVLLIELLEAPWWVLEAHVADHPQSPLAELIKSSFCASVSTTQHHEDLRYWVSSATLMRGVPPSQHGLRFINQKDPMAYPPIWTLAAAFGRRIGVWGTPFSHDWKEVKREAMDFYLPDKFGPDNAAHPMRAVAYQRILRLISRLSDQGMNVRMQRWRVRLALVHFVLSRAARLRIGALNALLRDDWMQLHTRHRALLSARLAFYEFLSVYSRTTPHFATLTLGSVATALHHDSAAFSAAAALPPAERMAARACTLVGRALRELDLAVNDVLAISRAKDVTVLLVSGYGQQAVAPARPGGSAPVHESAQELVDMWVVRDAIKLLRRLGCPVVFRQLPAMFPCATLLFQNNADRDQAVSALQRLRRSSDHAALVDIELADSCLSVKLLPDDQDVLSGELLWQRKDGGLLAVKVTRLGIAVSERRALTGEHAPGGVLIAHGRGIAPLHLKHHSVSETSLAATVLTAMGISPPDYMAPPDTVLAAAWLQQVVCF